MFWWLVTEADASYSILPPVTCQSWGKNRSEKQLEKGRGGSILLRPSCAFWNRPFDVLLHAQQKKKCKMLMCVDMWTGKHNTPLGSWCRRSYSAGSSGRWSPTPSVSVGCVWTWMVFCTHQVIWLMPQSEQCEPSNTSLLVSTLLPMCFIVAALHIICWSSATWT